jgi:cellulose synthase/poly-beta-1,6-N-acetylglucosamine synthase-like glycosyltransferase
MGPTLLTLLASLIAAPLAMVLAQFCLETALGLKPRRAPFAPSPSARPEVWVLIPAHDEAGGIADTLAHLLKDRDAQSSLSVLVVADNCSDATAERARAAGAQVVERTDRDRRGKGYALAFGRDWLARRPASPPPDAVVVIDADCRVSASSAYRAGRAAASSGHVLQMRNLLASDSTDGPLARISSFAMLVKNLVRARGLDRLAGGIPLFGTGMAFPWQLFADAPLATGNAVEDMQLALDLARRGERVRLFEDAQVLSDAATGTALNEQRSRWEHGFLATAGRHALPLLGEGLARRSRHLAGLGLHLLVPPLALLILVSIIGVILAGVLALLGASWVPALVLAGLTLVAFMLVALAWLLEGREVLPFATALRVPLYVLWKVPLYLRFFTNRQRDWNRTRRPNENR